MIEGFALNLDGTRIHYIDNGVHAEALPLVIVPGMMGIAEHHELELRRVPRRVIALSHRGLGRNPKIGVGQGGFEARVGDIATVAAHLELDGYLLYGFSRGVALAAEHTVRHPRHVRGLILHDCPPRYVRPSESWRDRLLTLRPSWMPAETIHAYWQDTDDVDVTPRLTEILCPTLLLRGALEGSMLSLESAEDLRGRLGEAEVKVLSRSGHEVDPEDVSDYLEILGDFCRNVDRRQELATEARGFSL